MVTLTQEAKDKLRSLIAAEGAEGAGLRVQVVPGGCSGFEYDLSLAAPAEGDEIVDGDGVRVIIDRFSVPVPARRRARLRGGLPGRRVPHQQPERLGLLRLREELPGLIRGRRPGGPGVRT